MTCWCVISLTWCRILAVQKCCTFRLKRKNLLSPTLDACCALLALRNIQLMTGEPRPPVQRAPVTWREWGLWSCERLGLLYLYIVGRQCQRHSTHHTDEILGCRTSVAPGAIYFTHHGKPWLNHSSCCSKFCFRNNTTMIQEQKHFVNTRNAYNIESMLYSAGGYQRSRKAHQAK